jgi:hypothetical protein
MPQVVERALCSNPVLPKQNKEKNLTKPENYWQRSEVVDVDYLKMWFRDLWN